MRRELCGVALTQVFLDTQAFYGENATLASAVRRSAENTKLYPADAFPPIDGRPAAPGRITVSKRRTLEAAVLLRAEYPDAKIAVLNFASATNPGGGVRYGSAAQEESLCRCSTLYPTLDQQRLWDCYYLPNRASGDALHTDACIYSPGVVICKSDDDNPQRLPEADFVTVDVITCAAPNLRRFAADSIRPQALYALHLRRQKHILHIAAANGADVLVLGAFGCGVFRNDPAIVAESCADALQTYAPYFRQIDFAIYSPGRNTGNYDAFRNVFAPMP